MKYFIYISIFFLFVNKSGAQDFVNNDLSGVINGASSLPDFWQKVPFTDVNSIATISGWDTPDLTDMSGPAASNGVMGNPYSGTTFLSGLTVIVSPPVTTVGVFQEGIMQTVEGFTIGCPSTVNFYQTVVKQNGNGTHIDSSGSWVVYIDSSLLGISTPTISSEPHISTSLPWEHRSFAFTPSDTSHTFKFLPLDDDNEQDVFSSLGGLRMGIDSIYIKSGVGLNFLGSDRNLCYGDTLAIGVNSPNATYLWQDSSINSTHIIAQQGTYWVTVTTSNCTLSDTILVNEENCEEIIEMPNVFTPNGDGYNDYFLPINHQAIKQLSLMIYNRWGTLVFITNTKNIGWDGYYNSNECSEGTYYWTIQYSDMNENMYDLNGTLTLIR